MTRVVFVNPLDTSATARGLGLKAPPLNLMYLAGAVEKAGFVPRIVDANLLNAPPVYGRRDHSAVASAPCRPDRNDRDDLKGVPGTSGKSATCCRSVSFS